jgi:hypothetical protein
MRAALAISCSSFAAVLFLLACSSSLRLVQLAYWVSFMGFSMDLLSLRAHLIAI